VAGCGRWICRHADTHRARKGLCLRPIIRPPAPARPLTSGGQLPRVSAPRKFAITETRTGPTCPRIDTVSETCDMPRVCRTPGRAPAPCVSQVSPRHQPSLSDRAGRREPLPSEAIGSVSGAAVVPLSPSATRLKARGFHHPRSRDLGRDAREHFGRGVRVLSDTPYWMSSRILCLTTSIRTRSPTRRVE
jgi:hypothetical protein